MPPLHRWELPNGLVVLFREDHRAPLLALEAVVKTGSATEGAWAGTGISHVVEHMLFKGTARRPVGAIEREVKSYGGVINGHTTHDDTGYTLTVHRDHAVEAIDLLADALQHPSFDPQELAKELGVVYRELKLRRDDPEQFTSDLVWGACFKVHPYRFPIVGFEPLLKSLTRDDILRYYRTRYLPNRTVLALVGDAAWPDVRAAIVRAFGGWPRGIEPGVVTPTEPSPVAPRDVQETADIAFAQLVFAWPSVALADPDLVALDTLAKILGEGRGSRLDLALREPGIVHEVASWNYTPRDPGLLAVTMRLDPLKIPEATAGLWEVVIALRESPVAAPELDAAKRAVVAQYLFSRQTVGAQAGDLAVNEVLVGAAEFSQAYVERVQAVTVADVQRVARRYLDPGRVAQVTVWPVTAVPPAATETPRPDAGAPIELVRLANGVRVLVREDPQLPIVTLRVTGLGGLLYETEATNGLSTLTARMLLRGTCSRSAREITEFVRALGGELASTSGRNSVGVSLALLSRDVAAGIQLLGDVWCHPSFPADEFLKEQRLLQAEIRHAEDDLFPWGSHRMFRALYPDHPYGLPPPGTAGSVASLSPRDVAGFHRLLVDPRRVIVSVFGDVRAREIVPWLEQAFGQPAPATTPPVVPASRPLMARQPVSDAWPREEAIVLVGFRGAKVTDPDAVPLDVLDMVLGGSGGRLFTQVRERQGQAYTVGSSAMPGVDPGSIVLYAVTAPEHAERVVKQLLDEVERVRTTVVTPDELAVATRGIIGAEGIRLQTNGALSLQASVDELYGLGWRASQEYPAKVQHVTAQELRRVAQRYLTPEACVVFVGRPRQSPRAPAAPEAPAAEPATR